MGVYDSIEDVEQAVQKLREKGASIDGISIIGQGLQSETKVSGFVTTGDVVKEGRGNRRVLRRAHGEPTASSRGDPRQPGSSEALAREGDPSRGSRKWVSSVLATLQPASLRLGRRAERGQALHESLDELALHQHRIGAGFPHGLVQRRSLVARQGDQAEALVVVSQAGDGTHAVQQRHVQVDHDRVRLQLVGELDRAEPVGGRADDRQLRLLVDQTAERRDKTFVVIREQNADRVAIWPHADQR